MNNKGFTTVELILTMAIVMIVMTTIVGVTYTYRDQSSYEEVLTEITDYKNSLTKIIYDDIFDIKDESQESQGKVIKINKVDDNGKKYTLETDKGVIYNLEIISETNKVGIKYGASGDEVEYIIPGSTDSLVSFQNEVTLQPNDGSESDIYLLDIYFHHKQLKDRFKIHIIVSN